MSGHVHPETADPVLTATLTGGWAVTVSTGHRGSADTFVFDTPERLHRWLAALVAQVLPGHRSDEWPPPVTGQPAWAPTAEVTSWSVPPTQGG